jgi:hypothetical protein
METGDGLGDPAEKINRGTNAFDGVVAASSCSMLRTSKLLPAREGVIWDQLRPAVQPTKGTDDAWSRT